MSQHLQETPPEGRFSGLDGPWLVFPNTFVCKDCGYGVQFSQEALARGFARRTAGEQHSNLSAECRSTFLERARKHLADDPARFALDFHCLRCDAPALIVFEFSEVSMGRERYAPVVVLE